MRFAATIALIVLNSVAFAATNATEVVCTPATNAVPVKVSKKAPKPARPQCEAITLSGNRCKRHAAEGSKYGSFSPALCVKAGNDLTMPGSQADMDTIAAAVGRELSLAELQACAKRVLALALCCRKQRV